MKPPRLTGSTLAAVRRAAETKGTDVAIREVMKRGLGIDQLAGLPGGVAGADRARRAAALGAPAPAGGGAGARDPLPLRGWPRPAAAYAAAYRDRVTTPRRVAERALHEIERLGALRPSMNVSAAADHEATLRDADASTARWAEGRPYGPLDGVPLLVTDELDVAGMPTTLGVRCQPQPIAERDAVAVARLRAAGAILVCKTVLTEWGMSPIGANVGFPMPHNAHDATRAPGGSAAGSAVGVALGVAPLAFGGDGDGSLRVPAALNGIFGLKPTFGRVSRAGDGFLGSGLPRRPDRRVHGRSRRLPRRGRHRPRSRRRDHRLGPAPARGRLRRAPSARACAAGASASTRPRSATPPSRWPSPAATPSGRWSGRARCSSTSTSPSPTTPTRSATSPSAPRRWPPTGAPGIEQRDLLADDLRLAYAVLAGLTALEHLDAQRLRTGLRHELRQALAGVDVIAFPTTAVTAPATPRRTRRLAFSDPAALEGLTRFAFLANLTGNPAGTAPVGADAAGLPIGLQIVGDAWDEVLVLSVLAHLERAGIASVRKPPGAVDLIGI